MQRGKCQKLHTGFFRRSKKGFPYEGKPWMCESPKPPLSGEVARRSRDGEVAANLLQPLSQPAADSSPERGAFPAAAG